jgi:Galactose mutarotase and related enzymes
MNTLRLSKLTLLFCLVGLFSCQKSELTLSGLSRKNFIKELPEGKTDLYVLKNKAGMEVCITNFGGRVVSVMAPDKDGKFADVVLGHDSIADYVNIDGNFGALIGRYGNRIGGGTFTLDGTKYQLPKNNFGHCLHGGPKGFHNQLWSVMEQQPQLLKLSYKSKDGEEGFPGNLTCIVTYKLTDDNALEINYEAETDKPTIVNLTNHSYFNLSGDPSKTILDHVVTLNASGFTPIDSTFMTTGEILPVKGTPMDFLSPKAIGKEINAQYQQLINGRGYDHNWVLDTKGDITRLACRVEHPASGRVLEVYTNEPGIQFYTGNFLDGKVTGKRGIAYPQHAALCLETQHYPDSPNKSNFPSVVLRPGQKYSSKCVYKFSTIQKASGK